VIYHGISLGRRFVELIIGFFSSGLLFLTSSSLSAGLNFKTIVWEWNGMSFKYTREVGDYIYRIYDFAPLWIFLPVIMGILISIIIQYNGIKISSDKMAVS